MTESGDEPTYAVQLMRPFIRALREAPGFPTEFLDELEKTDPTARFSVNAAQEMFRGAVAITGDEDLGLRAARKINRGDYEVVEYAASSASNWRAALDVIFRYCGLMNEAGRFHLDEVGGRAHIVMDSTYPLPRYAKDFQVAALHVASSFWIPAKPEAVTVCFRHSAPADPSGYAETFGDYRVVFDHPFDGFEFDAALLDLPMPEADPALHKVLREHAERLLSELGHGNDLLGKVRADIMETMRAGVVGVETTADHLHMSRRTLARRLREQGTSFSELLEDVRKGVATRYLETTRHTVEEVAFLLGYSSSAPFVRAFRRWTDRSPLEYRRAHRRF